MSDNQNWMKIERAFDAPIDAVWAMWTDPEMFKQWYGPNGMSIPVAEMDVRVGGVRKICMEMKMPDKTMTMWFSGVYKEVSAPTRLVYTESMCDADGNLIPASTMGMPEGHPDVTDVVIDLRADGATTHMTLLHVGVPEGSPGAGGWGQAIDKMAAMLVG